MKLLTTWCGWIFWTEWQSGNKCWSVGIEGVLCFSVDHRRIWLNWFAEVESKVATRLWTNIFIRNELSKFRLQPSSQKRVSSEYAGSKDVVYFGCGTCCHCRSKFLFTHPSVLEKSLQLYVKLVVTSNLTNQSGNKRPFEKLCSGLYLADPQKGLLKGFQTNHHYCFRQYTQFAAHYNKLSSTMYSKVN